MEKTEFNLLISKLKMDLKKVKLEKYILEQKLEYIQEENDKLLRNKEEITHLLFGMNPHNQ